MTRPAFVRQWGGASAGGVLSATNEAGVVAGDPVASSNNTGHMPLRASGIPYTTGSYDLALQRGGNATGYYTIDVDDTTVPGASLRYRLDGETSTQWRGYVDTVHLTYARPVDMATAVEDYPGISSVVGLSGGGWGYCRVMRHTIDADAVQFVYRTTRRGARTVVNIVTDGTLGFDTDHGPGLCRLASGRLLCAIHTTTGAIVLYYSDDDGATWASWSTDSGLNVGVVERQISMEAVEDAVLLVASMVPAASTVTAIVAWSYDGGQTFVSIATPTWGPTRTCVTATGVALAVATDQSTTTASVYRLFPGAGVGTSISGIPGGAHATASVLAIVRRDDGVLVSYSGSTTTLACSFIMGVSLDHGATWLDPVSQASTPTVWTNGINTATPRGFSQIGAGMFGEILIVVGVTDGTTAAQDDSNYELHFGGWDSLTEGRRTLGRTLGYSSGSYLALDIPTAVDWVATDAGTGASLTIDDEGLTISGDATNNSYFTAPSTFFATGSTADGWRWRIVFKATSGGSVADNSACIAIESDDGGGDIAGAYLRIGPSQIRLVDQSGTTIGTSDLVVNQFQSDTEVLIALDATYSASLGIVSAWFRLNGSTHWATLADAVTITKTTAAVTRPRIGALTTASAVWTLKQLSISADQLGMAEGFANPTDLHGRALSAARDCYLTNGISIGAAGGGGVAGDSYDLVTDASYAASWVWRTLRPSAEHRSTADNASHALVFDAAANNTIPVQFVGLLNTNFRTATFQMHASDSWATPSIAVGLDATLYQGTVSTAKRGLGYVGVDGDPWVPHQWRSVPGRRFFANVGGTVYEVSDSDSSVLYLPGGDFSAASGAVYIFGDRMGAVLSGGVQRYRYARALVGAQQTSDDYYRIGTVIAGLTTELTDPYANGFVWTYPDNTTEAEAEGGFIVTRSAGPIRSEIRMAWDPVSAPESKQLHALESLWRAVRGRAEPVLFGPDLLNRPNQFGLYHMVGPYAEENVTGELDNRLARVAQIILREVV